MGEIHAKSTNMAEAAEGSGHGKSSENVDLEQSNRSADLNDKKGGIKTMPFILGNVP